MYQYTDGGLSNVWLANGFEIHQTPFGEAVSFHDIDGLTEAICLALTAKVCGLTGAEFRYIRSAGMLLSQDALGQQIGTQGQTIARWEKRDSVPRWADKLIRLYYTAHARGNEPIRRVVERVKTVERLLNQKIVIEESRGHWKQSIHDTSDILTTA